MLVPKKIPSWVTPVKAVAICAEIDWFHVRDYINRLGMKRLEVRSSRYQKEGDFYFIRRDLNGYPEGSFYGRED